MREIKFRVWDKRVNKMHICGESTHDNMWFDENNIARYYNLQNGDGSGENGGYDLMQYTGIKDKNGKEIYEGDIVYMRCDCLSGFGEVFYESGSFWINDKKRKRTYPIYKEGKYRVDGNIYENPELLGDD